MGRYEVFANGTKIAERKTGLFARLLRGGWPDDAAVVERLKGMLATAS